MPHASAQEPAVAREARAEREICAKRNESVVGRKEKTEFSAPRLETDSSGADRIEQPVLWK